MPRQADISTIPMMLNPSENGAMLSGTQNVDRNAFRKRLKERIDALGTTARQVSLAIGANQGYVRDLLDPEKTSIPSQARAVRLAAVLQTTTDHLFGITETSVQPKSEVSFHDITRDELGSRRDMVRVLGTGYCDDLEVTSDGQVFNVEQTLFDPTTVVQLVERPPALINVADVYAIMFHGISMEPRYEQGDLAFVLPGFHPRSGDDVVVQLNNGQSDEVVHVLVKRLIKTTNSHIELEQFNPPLRFQIAKNRVTRMHKIARNRDIFGR